MEDFRSGKLQALIATTVIEVGVDVPNANLLILHHAERFGLAQIHQLRGRIGRGVHKSYCILLTDSMIGVSPCGSLGRMANQPFKGEKTLACFQEVSPFKLIFPLDSDD
jgi:RecG-like helicase